MYQNPLQLFVMMWEIFLKIWWLFVIPFFYGFYLCWMYYIQNRYVANLKWVFLQVSIPKENLVSPAFTEYMFAGLYGIFMGIDWTDKYIKGKVQNWINFEIVSIGGDIRFIIRCTNYNKDTVEAQIYAQYPEAEITETEDYVNITPKDVMDKKVKLWGTQLVLTKDDAYPIRTYPRFEHSLSQAAIDPLAGITGILNKLGPEEQMWIQLQIQPTAEEWKEDLKNLIIKLKGEKPEVKESLLVKILLAPFNAISYLLTSFVNTEVAEKKKEEKMYPGVMKLSPGEKEVLEAVEANVSKVGFYTKIRIIYFAPPGRFDNQKRWDILGAYKQFNTLDLNGFKEDKRTKVTAHHHILEGFRKRWRGQKLLNAYANRSPGRGSKYFVFNVEELATIFHLPDLSVKTPRLEKVEAKKATPPMNLPIE